jgi:hypothetical protein
MTDQNINQSTEPPHMTSMERDLELWGADQQLCDIADMFLRIMVEKQIDVRTALRIVAKMGKAIEKSIQSTRLGQPLIVESAPNEAATWLPHSELEAEFRCRQDDVSTV